MEFQIFEKLRDIYQGLGIPAPYDGRSRLKRNPHGRKWKLRNVKKLKGMVWHQELGWGSIEAVAKYHTGKNSHLCRGGVESISYSLAIRRNGQIVLCNDLNKATWSQGYKGRVGDENAEFLGVMFEGMFAGEHVTDSSAGEPNGTQMTSALILWQVCKDLWGWKECDLYGHYLFGKPSCPGNTLRTVIEAVRVNTVQEEQPAYDFTLVKDRQRALKKLGYLSGRADGIWGPQSRGALIRFQWAVRLVPDGIWGPKTEAVVVTKLKR